MRLKLLLAYAFIFSSIYLNAQVIEKHFGQILHRYTLLKEYKDTTYLFEYFYDSSLIFKGKTKSTTMNLNDFDNYENYCIDTSIYFDWNGNGDTIKLHVSHSNYNLFFQENYRTHYEIGNNNVIYYKGNYTYFLEKNRLKIANDSSIKTYRLRHRNFNYFILKSYLYDRKSKTYYKLNFDDINSPSYKKVGYRTYIETIKKYNLYSTNLLRFHYSTRFNTKDKYWFSNKKRLTTKTLSVYQYGLKTDSLDVKNNYKLKTRTDGYGNLYSYMRFYDKNQYFYQSKNYTKHLFRIMDSVFYRDTFIESEDTFLYNARLFGTKLQYTMYKNGVHVIKGEKEFKQTMFKTKTIADYWKARIRASYNVKRGKTEKLTFGGRSSQFNPYELNYVETDRILDISHWSNNTNLENGCIGEIDQMTKYYIIHFNDIRISIEGHFETIINQKAIIYENNSKYGIIDHKGTIYPAIYDSVILSGDNILAKRENDNFELIFLNTKQSKKILFNSIHKDLNHIILNNDSCAYIIHKFYDPFIIPIQHNTDKTRILWMFKSYKLCNPFLRSTVFLKSGNLFFIRSVDKCDWNNYTFSNLILNNNYIIAQHKDTIFRFGFDGMILNYTVGYYIQPSLMEHPYNLENRHSSKIMGFVVEKNRKYGMMDEHFKWLLKDSFNLINLKETFIVTLKDSNFQLFSWVYAPKIVPYKNKLFETIYNEDSSKYWTGINGTKTLICKQTKINDLTLLDTNKNKYHYSSKFRQLKNYYKDSFDLNNGSKYYIFNSANQHNYILNDRKDTILKGNYSDIRIINTHWAYVKQTNQFHYKLIDYIHQKTLIDSLDINQTYKGVHRNYYTNLLGYVNISQTTYITPFKYQNYYTLNLESGHEWREILVLSNKNESVGLYQNTLIPLNFERLYYQFFDTKEGNEKLSLMGYKNGKYYIIKNNTIIDSSEDIYWNFKPSKAYLEFLNWREDTTKALDTKYYERWVKDMTSKYIHLHHYNQQTNNPNFILFESEPIFDKNKLKHGFLLDKLREW